MWGCLGYTIYGDGYDCINHSNQILFIAQARQYWPRNGDCSDALLITASMQWREQFPPRVYEHPMLQRGLKIPGANVLTLYRFYMLKISYHTYLTQYSIHIPGRPKFCMY